MVGRCQAHSGAIASAAVSARAEAEYTYSHVAPIETLPGPNRASLQDLLPRPPAADPLAALDPAQRAAVGHGIGADGRIDAGPLLGDRRRRLGQDRHASRTAWRSWSPPGRSRAHPAADRARRAADDGPARASHPRAGRRRRPSRPGARQLQWAGTFHAIGARLLRDHAGRIGLDPGFSIHDREDSADLMNPVRHAELGLSATKQRFPQKGTCPAIYSAVVNTRAPRSPRVLQASFRGARSGRTSSSACSAPTSRPSGAAGARLRRPAAVLGADGGRGGARCRNRRPLRPRAGRRIPGHQRAAGGDPAR